MRWDRLTSLMSNWRTHLIDTSDVGIENTDVLRTVRVAEVTPHS